ncbi:hypothetical protein Syncc9902_0087 [Synechococcus sp. CC9902]|uniref:hypothetical protein n=1 Tax=Synechococcus sp. (strain CC9902) TaxID=316279 RepID=UPI00005D3CF0|nr:hypothetical protein [Synechococcus sp. CC9902]ABB25062.1 hypothetical protein Syncc9902_0087 [Synechococcus sp. CC9902]
MKIKNNSMQRITSPLMHENVQLITDINLANRQKTQKINIVGNGPSLLSSFDLLDQSNDTLGFSALIYSKIKLRYFIFEPLFALNNDDKESSEFKRVNNLLDTIFCSQIGSIIDKHEATDVTYFVNNQVITNQYGYISFPKKKKLYLPTYFYINESTDSAMLYCLKKYIESKTSDPLNFRGSMNRAISIAYLMNYQCINIFGLDPSTPLSWYHEDERDKILQKEIVVTDYFNAWRDMRIKNLKEFDVRKSEFSLIKSLFYTIYVMNKLFKAKGLNIPKINIVTSDPIVINCCSFFCGDISNVSINRL